MMISTLIVDDDPDMRLLFNSILDLVEGFSVVGEAYNGEEAIDLTIECKPKFIILDVLMPVMDGLTALPLLRNAASPDTKIAVVTALVSSGIVSQNNVFERLSDGVRPDLIIPKDELLISIDQIRKLFE